MSVAAAAAAATADPTVRDIVQLFRQPSPSSATLLPSSPPDQVVRREDTTPAALTAALEYIHTYDPVTWNLLRMPTKPQSVQTSTRTLAKRRRCSSEEIQEQHEADPEGVGAA